MKQFPFIETKKVGGIGDDPITSDSDHTEAVALVEKHRTFFEHYVGGRIKVEPAPSGVKTFAFDLEKNIIYVNSMFYERLHLSEEKTVFATLHEIEHFLEKLQVLSEEGGERVFARFLKRIKSSKAFSLMDNCVADIRENRAVISRSNPGMRELEIALYREDLFSERDFTSLPRHIQFCQALLREARVPDEECIVSPDVREALRELQKQTQLMDLMTHPDLPMARRLLLQDKYIWPTVQALLEKDMEDRKKKEEQKKKETSGEEGKKQDGSDEEESAPEADLGGGTDPDKMFADAYKKAEEKFLEAVPMEETEKAFKNWQEAQKAKSADQADEDYAKKLGVDKADLQNYRNTVSALEKIVNPETDVTIMEELRNLFSRIISQRIKKAQAPRYPVEEGDELVDAGQLVADVKSGNLQPKVWEDTEIKEKKGDRFGEVEITLVCDRSSSMTEAGGQKAVEQRKCAVLVMEVLKEFAQLCEEEKMNIDKPLEVKSEIYSFANEHGDKTPLKKMSPELDEAESINILKKLYDLPGSTTDFHCLEAISNALDDKTKQKITEGELKKIVIVFTDGESDNAGTVQNVLRNLRESGVIVIGIGITKAGAPVLTTYAPHALVAEDVQQLPVILGDLLKEHLKDL